VLDVIQSNEPLRKLHQPENPMANAEGDVFYPNVNPVAEMTDNEALRRAYFGLK